GVPTDELRSHQEPELRNSSGIHERDASGALELGALDRCPEWTGGTIRLEPPLFRFVPKESADEREHARQQPESEHEIAGPLALVEGEHGGERNDAELADGNRGTSEADGQTAAGLEP